MSQAAGNRTGELAPAKQPTASVAPYAAPAALPSKRKPPLRSSKPVAATTAASFSSLLPSHVLDVKENSEATLAARPANSRIAGPVSALTLDPRQLRLLSSTATTIGPSVAPPAVAGTTKSSAPYGQLSSLAAALLSNRPNNLAAAAQNRTVVESTTTAASNKSNAAAKAVSATADAVKTTVDETFLPSANVANSSRKRPMSAVELNAKKSRDDSSIAIPELDADDTEDAGMCAEYAQDIIDYLLVSESKFMPDPDYISIHPDLHWNMRTILVDWLVEVHFKFKFLPETLFLAINIMDRVLSLRVCEMNKLQLVGLTALFIAAKTEEVITPPVSQFAYMVADDFPKAHVLEAEQYILRVLDYIFWAPGPFSFLRRISKVDDYNFHRRTLAKFFAEITLLDNAFLVFPPSLIAASSMWLARRLDGAVGWSRMFQFASNYTEPELSECILEMLRVLDNPPGGELFFTLKYNGKRYTRAAKNAQLLLGEIQQRTRSLPATDAFKSALLPESMIARSSFSSVSSASTTTTSSSSKAVGGVVVQPSLASTTAKVSGAAFIPLMQPGNQKSTALRGLVTEKGATLPSWSSSNTGTNDFGFSKKITTATTGAAAAASNSNTAVFRDGKSQAVSFLEPSHLNFADSLSNSSAPEALGEPDGKQSVPNATVAKRNASDGAILVGISSTILLGRSASIQSMK